MASEILPAPTRAPTIPVYRLSEAARRKILRGIDLTKKIPDDALLEIERQRRAFTEKNGHPFGL